ncbi:MAG TPA: hypothetical protein VM580_12160 [Labilithrix sp.]|nr:hypothetical protein [Labilithrix sp.]
MKLDQIDMIELHEAFASPSVHYARELGIPDEKLNVGGGAITLGPPLGCTGAKAHSHAPPRPSPHGEEVGHRFREGLSCTDLPRRAPPPHIQRHWRALSYTTRSYPTLL